MALNDHYIIMKDPAQYKFFTDDSFPQSIHNFKITFAVFLVAFWIFRSVLRWKEHDILFKEKENRNIVCVNIARHTARGLTRDHLLRFLSRLYKKENKPCGKLFLPTSIRKETFRTAFVFPQIEQNELLDYLDQKYRGLVPLPIAGSYPPSSPTSTTTTALSSTTTATSILQQRTQFKPGQVISFDIENETQLASQHEPNLLITFYVNSSSDCGASTIFPYLGVKTSSIYSYYDKYYGTRSDGVYLTHGNGLYPSRSKYQHGNLRDVPSGKDRLISYKENQMKILAQWLSIYKSKLATGRFGSDPFGHVSIIQSQLNQINGTGTSSTTGIGMNNGPNGPYSSPENNTHNNSPTSTTNLELAPLITIKSSTNIVSGQDIHLLPISLNSHQTDQVIGVQQPFGNNSPDSDSDDPTSPVTTNPQTPIPIGQDDGISPELSPTDNLFIGGRSGEGSEGKDGQSQEGLIDSSPNPDLINPFNDPPPGGSPSSPTSPTTDTTNNKDLKKPYKHVSGVYTSEIAAIQRRINSYLTDPRYARSGAPFATLPKQCPLNIKAMQTLQPITVKNTKNSNGALVTLKIPLSTIDKLLQTKHQSLKQLQGDKKTFYKYQQQNGSGSGTYDEEPNNGFLPIVFVVTGTIGDCTISEVVHLDFTQPYTRDLYPQRHYLELPSEIANTADSGNKSPNGQEETTTPTTAANTKSIKLNNIISVADSLLSSRDLYNPDITTHINPDTIDWDRLDPNSKPQDTRLPLQYQLLRSGRIATPFYEDIYDLKRPVFSTIETGLYLDSANYKNYFALFPTFGLAQESDGTDCNICYCEPKRVIALPCRHIATCQTCAQQLVKCCLCRSDIQSFCTFIVNVPDQPPTPGGSIDPVGQIIPSQEPRPHGVNPLDEIDQDFISPIQQYQQTAAAAAAAGVPESYGTPDLAAIPEHNTIMGGPTIPQTTTTTTTTTQSTGIQSTLPATGGRVLGGTPSTEQDRLTAQQRAMRQYLQQQQRQERDEVEQRQTTGVFGFSSRQPAPLAVNSPDDFGIVEGDDDEELTEDSMSSRPTSPNAQLPSLPSQSSLMQAPGLEQQLSVRTPYDNDELITPEENENDQRLSSGSRINTRPSVRAPLDQALFRSGPLETHLEESEDGI